MAGIIGQVLFVPDSGSTEAYVSAWFPSNGNKIISTLNVIAIIDFGEIEVEVQTKNSEQDDGNAVTLGTTSGVQGVVGDTPWAAGADLLSGGVTGLLELVRYQYTITAGKSAQGHASGVHFRMLNPGWLSH